MVAVEDEMICFGVMENDISDGDSTGVIQVGKIRLSLVTSRSICACHTLPALVAKQSKMGCFKTL